MNAIEHLHKLAQEAIVLPEVGNYVRTEYGIDKIIGYRHEPEYENCHVLWFEKSDSGCRFTDKNLPKSSPNIIDLIEVGDYVNGFEVLRINKESDLYPKTLKCQYTNNTDYFDVFNEDIKSILTKEQFSQMEYKIGE